MIERDEEARWEQRLLAGDLAALPELMRINQARLYRVVLRVVNHADDAAELTQDAMVRILQHAERFDGRSAFSTWVTRIGINLAISHLRKRRHRRAASLDADPDTQPGVALRLVDHREPSPAQRVEQDEMIALMRQCLEELEPDMRTVLVLRDLEQMDYQAIAQSLGVALGTVKSRLFRARLALRQLMEAKFLEAKTNSAVEGGA